MLLSRLTQTTINSVHTEKKEGDTIAQGKRYPQYKVVIDSLDYPEYFNTYTGAMDYCAKHFWQPGILIELYVFYRGVYNLHKRWRF